MSDFRTHLESGCTTLCRCWRITRRDGEVLGFTDHDLDLVFDGIRHRAGSGLGARALSQTTGLSVDNTEAMGALSHEAIRAEDLLAGRYDGAEVQIWRVNWATPELRELRFRGSIGEISQGAGAFRAELRGLAEALNLPQGRVYQRPCSAVLGDARCRMDLNLPGYAFECEIEAVSEGRILDLAALPEAAARWFERGRLVVLSGAAVGLAGVVKNDRPHLGRRRIELWEPLRATVEVGDRVRLEAGCDRMADTCRVKFDNLVNFQGFPHLPSEDWLMAAPKSEGA